MTLSAWAAKLKTKAAIPLMRKRIESAESKMMVVYLVSVVGTKFLYSYYGCDRIKNVGA